MSAYGIPEADVARVVGIDPKTLRKHYREELDLGGVKANAQVAGFLFNSARNGNVTAQIFWLKTRAQWKETVVNEVVGKDGGPIRMDNAARELFYRQFDAIPERPRGYSASVSSIEDDG